MKISKAGVAVVALMLHATTFAAIAKVEFDLTINRKYDSSLQQYVDFDPMTRQYASLTFDNGLTSTNRSTLPGSPLNQYVFQNYGSVANIEIDSPVSALFEASPFPGTPVTNIAVVSSSMRYGPLVPDYTRMSFTHQISVYMNSGSVLYEYPPYSYERQDWGHNISIAGPLEILGNLDQAALDSFDFTSDNLMTYLNQMKESGGLFTFSEGAGTASYPAMKFTGYRLEGIATITNIIGLPANSVPEPATAALLGLGFLGVVASRRNSEKSKNV